MTTDLKYLAWTALLTASLWIPYIVCQVMTNGNLRAADYLDPTPRPLPLWGQRLNRVHQNAVEVFAPFAALVLVAQITSKADAMTAFWAALFFWARLAHAVGRQPVEQIRYGADHHPGSTVRTIEALLDRDHGPRRDRRCTDDSEPRSARR